MNYMCIICIWFCITIINLTPTSDKHLISPYNITPESNIKFMRIKEMITS